MSIPNPIEAAPGAEPAALGRLLAAVARHFPEVPAEGTSSDGSAAEAGARLVRSAYRWIEPHRDAEIGIRAALALADLRLDPATLAATLVVGAGPERALSSS